MLLEVIRSKETGIVRRIDDLGRVLSRNSSDDAASGKATHCDILITMDR